MPIVANLGNADAKPIILIPAPNVSKKTSVRVPSVVATPPKSGRTIITPVKSPIAQEYRELFTALLKIKDSALTARVLSAINNTSVCSKCRNPIKSDVCYKNAETQTISRSNFVRTQSCQTNLTLKKLDITTKLNRKRGPYAVDHQIIHPTSDQIVGDKPIRNTERRPEVNIYIYMFKYLLFSCCFIKFELS